MTGNSLLNEVYRTKYIQKEILEILVEFHNICERNNLRYILDFGTLLGSVRHGGFIPWDDDIDVAMPREDYIQFSRIIGDMIRREETELFYQTHETDREYFFPFAKLRKKDSRFQELVLSHFDIQHGPWIDIFVYDHAPMDRTLLKENVAYINRKRKFISYITPIIYDRKVVNQYFLKTWFKKNVISILKTSDSEGVVFRYLNRKYKKLEHAIRYSISLGNSSSGYLISYSFNMYNDKSIKENSLPNTAFEERKLSEFEGFLFYIPKDYHEILVDRYGNYRKLPPIEDRKSNHLWNKDSFFKDKTN